MAQTLFPRDLGIRAIVNESGIESRCALQPHGGKAFQHFGFNLTALWRLRFWGFRIRACDVVAQAFVQNVGLSLHFSTSLLFNLSSSISQPHYANKF